MFTFDAAPALYWATEEDHAAAVALLMALFDEVDPQPTDEGRAMRGRVDADIRAVWASQNSRIVLARWRRQVVAFGRADILHHDPLFRMRRPDFCGYIDQMYVAPEVRRRGLGRQVLGRLEGWLRARGCDHVLLHAAPAAVDLYRRAAYLPQRQMLKRLETGP